MSRSGFVSVAVQEIKAETEPAFLCLIDGEDVWLPKSQLADPEDYAKGDKNLSLSVTEWIAREKDLETEE